MGKAAIPKGGNDKVMTPEPLAKALIAHYNPQGHVMEPCRGTGSFYDNFTSKDRYWCEITQGVDFLTHQKPYSHIDRYDWIFTNPPWSLIMKTRKGISFGFLPQSLKLADNVMFLCYFNHLFTAKRIEVIEEAGFKLKEICITKTPPKKYGWQQGGLLLAGMHLQRDFTGDTKWSRIKVNYD